ncbi:MAG: response regulator [Elusimicrobia bacterium]|nr:response regulator [Elusimicrobiota bacterium]
MTNKQQRRDANLSACEHAQADGSSSCGAAGSGAVNRRPAKREIEHLNRVLLSIRNVNRLITSEEEPHRLIQSICELLIEQHGYLGAMIVMSDEAGKIGIYSEAGMGERFKPLAESLDRGELPPCCAGAKATEGIYYVRLPSPRLKKNAGAARESGCYVDYPAGRCAPCPIVSLCAKNKTMCVSLVYHGKVTGYLAVSVESSRAIGKEEQELFLDVAGDVAVALYSLAEAAAIRQSEQKRAAVEAQLRQAQKMEVVGRLAGGVAHDFNNILTAIKCYAGFIQEDLSPQDPKFADTREILDSVERAISLTRQLLAFSRRQIMSSQVVDVNRILENMTNMLRRIIGEDITVETRLFPGPCLALVDPGQLEQVIMNLAVNARDAMSPSDGGRPVGETLILETEIIRPPEEFFAARPNLPLGPLVRLKVLDTGCGMTTEVKSRLFEPFFTTKEPGRGTGLGLSMVFGIVKQSRGEIEIESEPGKGSTFLIYLPLAKTPPAEAGNKGGGKYEGKDEGRGKNNGDPVKRLVTVLFVEDEEALRRLGERVLRAGGYTVLAAANGRAAFKLMEERGKPVDLLLTDVVMPGMSGRELALELARRSLVGRVLYMSGYTDDAVVKHGVLEPGIAFIYKPFTVKEVMLKLREVLNGPAGQAKA